MRSGRRGNAAGSEEASSHDEKDESLTEADADEEDHSALEGSLPVSQSASDSCLTKMGGTRVAPLTPSPISRLQLASPTPGSKVAARNSFGSTRRRPFTYMLCFLIGIGAGFIRSSPYQSEAEQTLSQSEQISGHRAMSFGSDESSLLSSRALPRSLSELHTDLGYNTTSLSATRNLSTSSPAEIRALFFPPAQPLLIIVTPTYIRPFQAMYLTRLGNALSSLPKPVLWLVVELTKQSPETAVLLRESGLMYRHLVAKKNMTDVKDRGVHQRNAALEHIQEHRLDGIVFFADDDNVYSNELFDEIRKVKRFGVWPVAMAQQGKSRPVIEGPVCDEAGKVLGWHTNEKSKRLRRFHVDMCGFAFNSTILWDPARWHKSDKTPIRQLDSVKEGFQETSFIEQLVPDESAMEGLAFGCSRILVWHLHLEGFRTMPFPHWSLPSKLPITLPLSEVAR
eukprot:TRINITY_DN655_c1_g1_i1.p1 TRINITY_DN655_c1_g1~~TRINITY_DN655_c1_g1_i1.p1  ORF type:complete len:453 (+),score=45.72 TRINITY_DN655_c1_g1_i1:720-2078(+)